MQYVLMIYADETTYEKRDDAETAAMLGRYAEVVKAARDSGIFVDGNRLRPTATATTVRRRNGERLVTDGPFAETKEQLGGYMLIDAPSLDEAIKMAADLPGAEYGSIEIRPVWEP